MKMYKLHNNTLVRGHALLEIRNVEFLLKDNAISRIIGTLHREI